MESVFPVVVFGAVGLSVVMSLVFLLSKGSVYDQVGQGGISREGEAPASVSAPPLSSAAGRAEQEQEIRQMLVARSRRLVSKGEPGLNIDAEVAKLLALQPRGHDAALHDEVRQLVMAKNERRVRQGLEPLNIAAEVQRTLAELDP